MTPPGIVPPLDVAEHRLTRFGWRAERIPIQQLTLQGSEKGLTGGSLTIDPLSVSDSRVHPWESASG